MCRSLNSDVRSSPASMHSGLRQNSSWLDFWLTERKEIKNKWGGGEVSDAESDQDVLCASSWRLHIYIMYKLPPGWLQKGSAQPQTLVLSTISSTRSMLTSRQTTCQKATFGCICMKVINYTWRLVPALSGAGQHRKTALIMFLEVLTEWSAEKLSVYHESSGLSGGGQQAAQFLTNGTNADQSLVDTAGERRQSQ